MTCVAGTLRMDLRHFRKLFRCPLKPIFFEGRLAFMGQFDLKKYRNKKISLSLEIKNSRLQKDLILLKITRV